MRQKGDTISQMMGHDNTQISQLTAILIAQLIVMCMLL